MHYRLPYVGPNYPARRIVVVGMNARDRGLIDDEYKAVREVVKTFERGERKWGGYFHFRAACAVAALAAAQDGVEPALRPRPEALVDPLLSSARIQSVQCAPGPPSSRRSPTSRMWENCPPFVMADELELIQPRAVVLLGVETHRRFQELTSLRVRWSTSWREGNRCFARGSAQVRERRFPVFALSHPASSRWSEAMATFVENLNDEGLSALAGSERNEASE